MVTPSHDVVELTAVAYEDSAALSQTSASWTFLDPKLQ